MTRYEVIESRVWRRDDGMKASIYGALPWTNPTDKARWQMTTQGYTIRDNRTNTVGLGRKPFETKEAAQELADKLNGKNEIVCHEPSAAEQETMGLNPRSEVR